MSSEENSKYKAESIKQQLGAELPLKTKNIHLIVICFEFCAVVLHFAFYILCFSGIWVWGNSSLYRVSE